MELEGIMLRGNRQEQQRLYGLTYMWNLKKPQKTKKHSKLIDQICGYQMGDIYAELKEDGQRVYKFLVISQY